MALKFQLENLEGVEESLHSLYREDGGQFILDVEGAKSAGDFEKVKNALESERKEKKQHRDAASVWESRFSGKTPDEIVAALERIPVLEAESQGKIDQKKLDLIVETTVKSRTAPLELELNKRAQLIAEREQVIERFKADDRRRTIHDAIRGQAAKEGFQESTYADSEGALMLMAERHFTINSVGDVVVADESRTLTPGLAVREALSEIKNRHPYMLKQSVGGGASGGANPGTGPSDNPFKTNNIGARAKRMEELKGSPEKLALQVKQAGLNGPLELHKDGRK